jgi:hypothetical protein
MLLTGCKSSSKAAKPVEPPVSAVALGGSLATASAAVSVGASASASVSALPPPSVPAPSSSAPPSPVPLPTLAPPSQATSPSASATELSKKPSASPSGGGCDLFSLQEISQLTGISATAVAERTPANISPFIAHIGCNYTAGGAGTPSAGFDVNTAPSSIPVQAIAAGLLGKLKGGKPISVEGNIGVEAVIPGALPAEEVGFYKGQELAIVVVFEGKGGAAVAMADALANKI